MVLTLVYENEQIFIKSAFTVSEKARGHALCLYRGNAMPWPQRPCSMPLPEQCCALAIEAPWCQLSSFLLGLLVWEAALCVCWSTHGAMLLGGRVIAWGPVDLPSCSKCGPGQQPLLGAWQKCQISGLTHTSLVEVCSITRTPPPIMAGIHVQYLKTQEEVLTSIFIENLPHVRQ